MLRIAARPASSASLSSSTFAATLTRYVRTLASATSALTRICQAVPPIIERSMAVVLSTSDDADFTVTSSLFLHSLELVVTAIFYNPALSLAILERHNWTGQLFTLWFKHIPKYTRVHDKKISIGAICGIFEFLAGNESPQLAQGSSQLLVGALLLFRDFPAAIQGASRDWLLWSGLLICLFAARVQLEKDYAEGGGDEDDDEDEEEIEFSDDENEGACPLLACRTATDQIPLQLRRETFTTPATTTSRCSRRLRCGCFPESSVPQLTLLLHQAGREDDEDSDAGSTWSEEILWASPLDEIDMYQRFTATITGSSPPQLSPRAFLTLFSTAIETVNPALFQLATQPLDGAARAELEAVAARSLRGGEKADLAPVAAP